MFVKNIFRNKFKKISKKTCEKIKEQIDKSEFIKPAIGLEIG